MAQTDKRMEELMDTEHGFQLIFRNKNNRKVYAVILHRLQDWSWVKSHLQQLNIPYQGKVRGTGPAICPKKIDSYDLLVDELIKQQM